MKKFIVAGNVPYLAAAVLAATAFYLGHETSKLTARYAPRVAFAEKGAVILNAALGRQNISSAVLDEQIKKPILAVIQRYVDQGYVVIDSSRDENGNMVVSGIPPGAIDITPELTAALNTAKPAKTGAAAPSSDPGKQ